MFSTFWPSLPASGRQPNGPFLAQNFFGNFRPKSALLEPLNGAYLEPKSWLKNLIFDKNEKVTKKV